MQWGGLVAPTYAALRSRIVACAQVLDFLDAVAMHPQARSIIATAVADLDTVSRQLRTVSRQPSLFHAAAFNKADSSLSFVEARAERLREAIAAGGPLALPVTPPD
jgi:hypothetical protein